MNIKDRCQDLRRKAENTHWNMLDNDFNNMNDVVDGAYDREIYVEIFSITVITVIKSLSVTTAVKLPWDNVTVANHGDHRESEHKS